MSSLIKSSIASIQLFDEYIIHHRKNNTPVEILRIFLMMLSWLALLPVLLVLLPFKYLFYMLCNRLVISGTRYRNGQVQMAQDHYIHPVTGRKIVLTGMLHQAEKRFYQNIYDISDYYSHRGFVILTEGVAPLTKSQFKKVSRKVKMTAESMVSHITEDSSLSLILDLRLQHRESHTVQSKNIDIDVGCILKTFQKNGYQLPRYANLDRLSVYENFTSSLREINDRKFIVAQLKALCGGWAMHEIFARCTRRGREYNEVIINFRNQNAVKQIQQTAITHDVLSLWGAGHLNGMGALLKKQGYKRIKRSWNVALDAQTLQLNPEFKEYIENKKIDQFIAIFGNYITSASMTRNK